MLSKVADWLVTGFLISLVSVSGVDAVGAAPKAPGQLDPALQAQEVAAINSELEAVAKKIAVLLQHPGFRGQLRGEINGAKTTESIIEIEKFLAGIDNTKNKGAPPGLAKARDATNKAAMRIKNSPAWGLEGIDLYFPVQDHKAKWKGNEDLLVAYSPVTEEAAVKSIVAYSVRSQKKVSLDPHTPPTTPVLVVAAEEHESHEIVPAPPIPRGTDVPEPISKEEAIRDMRQATGDEPETAGGNSTMQFSYLKIYDDKEPWTKGSPEIFVVYVDTRYANSPKWQRKELSWVDKEGRWYWTGSHLNFFFDSVSSNHTYIAVWERDGPTFFDMLLGGPGTSGMDDKMMRKLYATGPNDDLVGDRVFYKTWYP